MQKIVPNLWFDTQAAEAAEFYTQAFPNSMVTSKVTLKGTPSGDADLLSFELNGYGFMAISAGPYFTINPSISFMVNFDPSRDEDAREQLDDLWEQLIEGGEALMPLGEYPFSKRYGWVKDRFGVSWQLILTNPDGEPRPFIIPSLLFANQAYGKADEARQFYLEVFRDSKEGVVARYPAGMEPNQAGTIMFSDFMLEGEWLTAMDGGGEHNFNFNEAVSLMVKCVDQDEIDYYWEKLSAVPEAEQCGWLKDKFGISWQIAPHDMDDMMNNGSPEQIARVTQSFLQMKKFDLAKLRAAYNGS